MVANTIQEHRWLFSFVTIRTLAFYVKKRGQTEHLWQRVSFWTLCFFFFRRFVLYCHGIQRITHDNTFPCIDGYLGIRDRQNVGYVDDTYTVIMDGELLFPHTVNLLCLIYFNVLIKCTGYLPFTKNLYETARPEAEFVLDRACRLNILFHPLNGTGFYLKVQGQNGCIIREI